MENEWAFSSSLSISPLRHARRIAYFPVRKLDVKVACSASGRDAVRGNEARQKHRTEIGKVKFEIEAAKLEALEGEVRKRNTN